MHRQRLAYSDMRFSRKVFLATALLGTGGGLAGAFAVMQAARAVVMADYQRDYAARVALLGNDFLAEEKIYYQLALNAAYATREADAARKGKLSDTDLAALAKKLGVYNLKLIDATGKIVASGDGSHQGNLFQYCDGYRGLLSGRTEIEETPLVLDARNPGVTAKFVMIPALDHRRIIDVTVRFDAFSEQLKRVVEDTNDIEGVALFLNKQELGRIGKLEFFSGPNIFTTTFEKAGASCCECQTRGFSDDGKFKYRIVAQASGETFRRLESALLIRFAFVAAAVVLVAFLFSAWLSQALLRGLNRIREAVDHIAAARDFSHEIPVGPDATDELGALARHFNKMFASMRDAQAELLEAKKAEARASVAAQVAHDIRSPLTSMTLALNRLQGVLQANGALPTTAEMISILSHGISRVSGILKRLSGGAKNAAAPIEVEKPRLTLIDKLFFDVAQEAAMKLPPSQRLEITGFPVVPGVWSVVQVAELQSALSNLLNNASEAAGENGRIVLTAVVENNQLGIIVRDNGKGIPADVLPRLFERGATSGKVGGSGLGLYQAKKAVEWYGGKIRIESKAGEGTSVILAIPTERAPSWCVDEVRVAAGQTLVVADDDPVVLAVWREKAAGLVPLREFPTMRALEEALPSLGDRERLVFVLDQYASSGDGRDALSGTVMIEKHGLGQRAYLSTSEYDDPAIQDKIKALKAKMIPKPRLAAAKVVDA